MGLKGNLKTILLPDLLRLLANGKATGLLEVVRDNVRRSIYFQGGRFISADSSEPRDFLGHFLVSRGKITEDQLNEAMVIQQQTRKVLGKTLVTMGALSDAEMTRLLMERCVEILLTAFILDDADFEFFDNTPPPVCLMSESLEVEPIVQQGVLRSQEYRALRRKYPSRGICFEKTSSATNDSVLNDEFVSMVYGLIDGRRTVREIILQTHTNEYLTFKCLHVLQSKGLISILDPNKEPTRHEEFKLKAEDVLQFGKRKLVEGNLEEAINVFRYLLSRNAEDKEAQDLLTRAEEGLIRRTHEEAFSADAVPLLARTLAELASAEILNSEESFVLSRVNGQWDVKSILTVTPLPEVDVLQILKRLQRRGIIRFR